MLRHPLNRSEYGLLLLLIPVTSVAMSIGGSGLWLPLMLCAAVLVTPTLPGRRLTSRSFPVAVAAILSLLLFAAFLFALRKATGAALLPAAAAVALLLVAAGVRAAHELLHQIHSPLRVWSGRLLLTLPALPDWAIGHVPGHHNSAGTDRDPGSARKGESVYGFCLRFTVTGWSAAWRLEAARLRRGTGRRSLHHLFTLTLLTAAWPLVAWAAAGWRGVAGWAIVALLSRFLLAASCYARTYGLVRDPRRPVDVWHFRYGGPGGDGGQLFAPAGHPVPGDPPPGQDGLPVLPAGGLACVLLSLVPPLWRRIMHPLLAEWERSYHPVLRTFKERPARMPISEAVKNVKVHP